VQISDKASVEAALAAYDLLSPEAQVLLTSEKALLDSLLAEINSQEAIALEVSTFQSDYATPLALTTGTVQISDKASVEAALAAYDLLSPAAQALLASEKALLDSLLVEIEAQQLAILNAIKSSILAETYLNIEINADTSAERLSVLDAQIALLVTDPDVSYTLTFVSGDTYQVELTYNGLTTTVLVDVTATFVLSQDAQNLQDVNTAATLIKNYFITGKITLTNYSNPTKYNAFLAQANTLVEGLGVIIEITQDLHQAGNNPSTFTITILKGTQLITTTITVNYSK
jgi:hypothetical protein